MHKLIVVALTAMLLATASPPTQFLSVGLPHNQGLPRLRRVFRSDHSMTRPMFTLRRMILSASPQASSQHLAGASRSRSSPM